MRLLPPLKRLTSHPVCLFVCLFVSAKLLAGGMVNGQKMNPLNFGAGPDEEVDKGNCWALTEVCTSMSAILILGYCLNERMCNSVTKEMCEGGALS